MEKSKDMAITKKLSRVGKSYSLIIDKNIMKLMDIDPDTELSISVEGESLLITPVKKEIKIGEYERKQKIDNAFQRSIEKYASVYKKLAQ